MANLSNINNKFIVTDGNNGRVLIGATNDIGATLFANHPSTTAPSLTFNAPAGQVFENEDLQFAFGLNNASPYNGYMQTRFVSAPYYRNLAINPLGGNVGIGTNSPSAKLQIKGSGTSASLSFKTTDVSNNETFYILDGGRVGVRYWPLTVGLPSSSSAASNAAFQVKVNNDFTVLTSGFVGIGTDLPLALLSLNQANGANIRFTNSTTGRYFTIGEGVGTNDVFSFRGNSYRSTDTMSIDFVNDRVGIGTISPSFQLSIENHDTTTSIASMELDGKRTNGTDGAVGELIFSNNGDTFATVAGFRDGSDNKGSLQFQTQDSTFTTKMTISSEGNVGIGTISPDIGSNAGTAILTLKNTGTNRAVLNMTSTTPGTGVYAQEAFYNGGVLKTLVQHVGDGTVDSGYIKWFTTASSGSTTERMRIHSGGSVTMGEFNSTNAPNNGILKIKTGGSTAGTCYPLLSIMGSTHLATRQYGIGMDPEGYSNRLKMFFGVDGMGNGYSFGDFVWNINTQVGNDIVSPSDERMRLDKSGDLKLKTGSLVITDTSKGIYLGGTGSTHKLNYYKEGTWTPTLNFGGNSVGITYGGVAGTFYRGGHYTRIGRVVTFSFRIILTSKGTSTGEATITGLPFIVANLQGNYGSAMFSFANNFVIPERAAITMDNGSSIIRFRFTNTPNGNYGNVSNSDFNNNSDIILTGTYQAAP